VDVIDLDRDGGRGHVIGPTIATCTEGFVDATTVMTEPRVHRHLETE
jgi:hypothetical protein